MNTTYDVGNTGPSLGQAQKCAGVKPINGISFLINKSPTTIHILVLET